MVQTAEPSTTVRRAQQALIRHIPQRVRRRQHRGGESRRRSSTRSWRGPATGTSAATPGLRRRSVQRGLAPMRLLQRRSRGNPRRPGPMRRWAHGVGHALVAEAASGSLVACSCAAPLLAFQARGELAWRLLEVRRDGLRCTACSAAGAVGQGVSTKRCRNHLRWTLGHITANVGSTGRGSTVVSMLRRDTPAYSAPTAGLCLRS